MMSINGKKAVVLLSGGIDSSTTLAVARAEGYDCYALSFDYSQRHKRELESARMVAQALKARRHMIIRFDLSEIGGSALTDKGIEVPKKRGAVNEIPVTYVPARNTIFLSFALGWAEVLGADTIFIGANAVDYSGYPDCRPEFLQAFEQMANLGTKKGSTGIPFKLHAPLIKLSKREIVQVGMALGVDYSITHSCYDPVGELACGHCDACLLRMRGFAEAGLEDPIRYAGRK